MSKTVAFLRAINVGGRRVKMADLAGIFSDMGLSGVSTYIASGNVVFDTPDDEPEALARRIEEMLAEALGYEVPVMLRGGAELAAIVAASPFAEDELVEGETVYVSFLREAAGAEAAEALRAAANAIDDLRLGRRDVYWLYNRHLGESTLTNAGLEKLLGGVATRRNLNTVRKLVGKYRLGD